MSGLLNNYGNFNAQGTTCGNGSPATDDGTVNTPNSQGGLTLAQVQTQIKNAVNAGQNLTGLARPQQQA